MRWIQSALAACIVVLAVSSVAAQTGGLVVTVLDESGTPLPGATVTISHETSFVKTTAALTSAEGLADFPVLRPGQGYSIHVSFPGFSPVRHDDLRVRSNDTLRIAIQMIEQIQEQVRVTAQRDVIDLDASENATKFSQDFIGDLPVPGRFYQNVLTMAPGVQDADGDGNPNVHGSRERDFAAMVSGVRNVDPLTGQWMSRVNPNSIEELEVITAGAGVEFGRAQGGFARIIQKQGNNEHEGLFEFYYRTSQLDGTGAGVASAVDGAGIDDPEFTWLQPAVQLTGPILRDKMWYRLSHEYREIDEPVNTTRELEVSELTEWTHSDQLTWQVSPRNKLAFMYQSDPSERTKFGVSSTVPGSAAWDRNRTGTTYQVAWTAPFSPRILIDSLVAYQDLNFVMTPTTEDLANDCVVGTTFMELSQCRNLANGQVSGSHFRNQDDRSQRFTMSGKATIYSQFLGASHQFKVGVSVENERYFRELSQGPFGVFFTNTLLDPENPEPSFTPTPHYQMRISVPESDKARATGTNWAIFAEDQIKPTGNVTVTAGLRVDREEINSEGRSQFDPSAELQQYQDFLEPLVPILLLSSPASPETYQAAASGPNGYPGIFTGFENFPTFLRQMQNVICENEENVGQCETFVAADFVNQRQEELINRRRAEDITISNTNVSPFLAVAWSPWSNGKTAIKASIGRHYNTIPLIVPLQELEPVLTELNYKQEPNSDVFFLEDTISPALTVQSVDRNLKTPYQDEFMIKVERELWAETSIQATYINRKFRDQIQDINTNVDVGDYGNCFLGALGGGVQPSPGSGHFLVDPSTGEVYQDTDPGTGDGRVDDCTGGVEVSQAGFGVTRPDGVDDLYVQNPFWSDIFLITNANSIDYEALVLELIRRQYRNWEMQLSYTYSRAEGDGEDFFQELGNDPSLRANTSGFQSYDQRHVAKANATTITPWGIRLGAAVTWQSGLPYSLLLERFSFDELPPISGPTFDSPGGSLIGTSLASSTGRTRQSFPTGVRNDQRNASFWNFDLRATKEFSMGRGVNMQLSAEVYNLFNDGTYTIYNRFTKSGQQINGINEAFNRFGRRWQLGLKLTW
jgi:hypothetical protein